MEKVPGRSRLVVRRWLAAKMARIFHGRLSERGIATVMQFGLQALRTGAKQDETMSG